MEPAVIGAISGLVVAGLAVLGFWLNWGDRLSQAQTKAEAATQDAHEANERVTALSAQFSLYREQAVREFVAHTTIADVERRLVQSQAKTEQRLVDALDGLNKRLDRLIEAGLRARGRDEVM